MEVMQCRAVVPNAKRKIRKRATLQKPASFGVRSLLILLVAENGGSVTDMVVVADEKAQRFVVELAALWILRASYQRKLGEIWR